MDEHRRQQLLRDRNAIDEELALLRERRRINRELAGPAPVISRTNDDERSVKQEKEVISLIDDDDKDDHMRIKQEKKAEFRPPVDAPFPFAPSNMLFHGRPEPAVDHEHQNEAAPARQGGLTLPPAPHHNLQPRAVHMQIQDPQAEANHVVVGERAVQPDQETAPTPAPDQQAGPANDQRAVQHPAVQPSQLIQQQTPPVQSVEQGAVRHPTGIRAAFKGDPIPRRHPKFPSLVASGDGTGYYELRCHICHGNYSLRKRDYLDGVTGLKCHLAVVHKGQLGGRTMSNREIVELCKVGRLITEEEVCRKRKSPAPQIHLAAGPRDTLTPRKSGASQEPGRLRATPKKKRKTLERKRKSEPVYKEDSDIEEDDTDDDDPDGEFRPRKRGKNKAR